ncbi:uncharacterized protein Hap1MRO34_004637 isoform 1-T1 [Clarias gariepinus]
MTPGIIRFSVMVLGNTMNSHKTFLDYLMISQKLYEVFSLDDSDVIIAFVPIVSRAGTDISAAMEKIPEGKPVVLVVLHHTFDPYYIAPDSRLCVNGARVFAVDCVYYEDLGLLRCQCNDKAIKAVKEHLKIEGQVTDDFICVLMNRYRWILLVFFVMIIVVSICKGAQVGAIVGIALGSALLIGVIVIVRLGVTTNDYSCV